jgi:hypothetical protein
MDAFAVEGKSFSAQKNSTDRTVFESSARLSILARNTAQLLSSLSGLVPGLYTAVNPEGKSRADLNDTDLSRRIEQLSLADSRAEFASILLLFHLAHSGSYQAFHNTFIELTAPTTQRLRRPFADPTISAVHTTEPFISATSLGFALQASRVLGEGTFDPLAYFELIKDQAAAGPYERAVLSWAGDKVRERAWKVFSKAYLGCAVEWAGRWCGQHEDGVEEWVKGQGGKIENGLVKTR